MDHRETAADGIYRMILYDLLCFASVPIFIFGGAARKVAGVNCQNPITESCHDHGNVTLLILTPSFSKFKQFNWPELTLPIKLFQFKIC